MLWFSAIIFHNIIVSAFPFGRQHRQSQIFVADENVCISICQLIWWKASSVVPITIAFVQMSHTEFGKSVSSSVILNRAYSVLWYQQSKSSNAFLNSIVNRESIYLIKQFFPQTKHRYPFAKKWSRSFRRVSHVSDCGFLLSLYAVEAIGKS